VPRIDLKHRWALIPSAFVTSTDRTFWTANIRKPTSGSTASYQPNFWINSILSISIKPTSGSTACYQFQFPASPRLGALAEVASAPVFVTTFPDNNSKF
jgi:hypothetical protein